MWPPPLRTPRGLCLVRFFYSIPVDFFLLYLLQSSKESSGELKESSENPKRMDVAGGPWLMGSATTVAVANVEVAETEGLHHPRAVPEEKASRTVATF